jgi:hypothetical protein
VQGYLHSSLGVRKVLVHVSLDQRHQTSVDSHFHLELELALHQGVEYQTSVVLGFHTGLSILSLLPLRNVEHLANL